LNFEAKVHIGLYGQGGTGTGLTKRKEENSVRIPIVAIPSNFDKCEIQLNKYFNELHKAWWVGERGSKLNKG